MLKELQESYVAKYESPMAARVHYAVLDGWADESTGSVEWAYAIDRVGKRIVFEDDQGFVTMIRFDSEAEAQNWFAEYDSNYAAWMSDEDQ